MEDMAKEILNKLSPHHYSLTYLLMPNLYYMLLNYEGIEINS